MLCRRRPLLIRRNSGVDVQVVCFPVAIYH